jgi:hypothetical protein
MRRLEHGLVYGRQGLSISRPKAGAGQQGQLPPGAAPATGRWRDWPHLERLFLPAFGAVPLDQLKVSHINTVFDRIAAENKRIRDARAWDDPGARRTVAGRRETGPTTGCASLTTATTLARHATGTERKTHAGCLMPCAEGQSAGELPSTAAQGVDMTTAATPMTTMRPGDLDERVSARVRPEPLAKGPSR